MVIVVPLIDPVPQVVNSPIFSVQKNHGRSRRHPVYPGMGNQATDQGITEQKLAPVVSTVPQQEGIKKSGGFFREDSVGKG